MITFTIDEQNKLYDLGFNEEYGEFTCDDISCYKSNETLYHLLYDEWDVEVNTFNELINKIKLI